MILSVLRIFNTSRFCCKGKRKRSRSQWQAQCHVFLHYFYFTNASEVTKPGRWTHGFPQPQPLSLCPSVIPEFLWLKNSWFVSATYSGRLLALEDICEQHKIDQDLSLILHPDPLIQISVFPLPPLPLTLQCPHNSDFLKNVTLFPCHFSF
jgi:hypothetical protein